MYSRRGRRRDRVGGEREERCIAGEGRGEIE